MSYAQAMKWHKKHPTGGKPQYMGFSTGSGFWPSGSWSRETHAPYIEACEKIGVEPFKAETFYHYSCLGHIMCGMPPENQALYTAARRAAGSDSP